MEGILRDAILEYLKRNNLMTQYQHGFTRDCSCQTNLISFYEECQCHYPVPQVSVSLSCTPSVSAIILYPKCQCHYPVPQVSVPLSCPSSVSAIILYPKCQYHYPVPTSDPYICVVNSVAELPPVVTSGTSADSLCELLLVEGSSTAASEFPPSGDLSKDGPSIQQKQMVLPYASIDCTPLKYPY
ncbi:unnamed protein product [Ranitomeya imitator]|uniref:Uncharacterized protein n=1 Tax=Ranitomeya imitator TaxID=111125 RepID=A0ABN9MIV0_9NEOB|nr:unnamed protein product [Ranitomeya imitator]